MNYTSIISAILPGLTVGLFLAAFNRRQARRDKKLEHRAEMRKQESLLSLQMINATAKLSYATAMAYKRGEPNGEIEEGIDAYDEAAKEYSRFMNRQAIEQLS